MRSVGVAFATVAVFITGSPPGVAADAGRPRASDLPAREDRAGAAERAPAAPAVRLLRA